MIDVTKIQQLMRIKGLSKRQLCIQCNISRITFDNLLSGGSPTLPTIGSIAKCLDVPISSLFLDYGNGDTVAIADNGSISAAGNASINVEADKSEIEALRKEIDLLRQLLDERERTINILSQFATK